LSETLMEILRSSIKSLAPSFSFVRVSTALPIAEGLQELATEQSLSPPCFYFCR
jgi:hypothetical protein